MSIDGCDEIDGVAVVIDVLRAFSFAAFALDAGAERLILMDDLAATLDLATSHPMRSRRTATPRRLRLFHSPTCSTRRPRRRTIVHRASAGTIDAVAPASSPRLLRQLRRRGGHGPPCSGVGSRCRHVRDHRRWWPWRRRPRVRRVPTSAARGRLAGHRSLPRRADACRRTTSAAQPRSATQASASAMSALHPDRSVRTPRSAARAASRLSRTERTRQSEPRQLTASNGQTGSSWIDRCRGSQHGNHEAGWLARARVGTGRALRLRHRVVDGGRLDDLSEWERVHLGELDADRFAVVEPPGAYLNHSCGPNALRHGVKVVAGARSPRARRSPSTTGSTPRPMDRRGRASAARISARAWSRAALDLDLPLQELLVPHASASIRREYRRRRSIV